MKIFIEDLVKKFSGGESEVELPFDSTIRFEGLTAKFSISMNENGELKIYKICKNAIEDSDEITVKAPSANVFIIS